MRRGPEALKPEAQAKQLTRRSPVAGSCFEVLLVNDGSRDASWSEIAAVAAENRNVQGIDLMRNFGQHNAVLAGVRAATGDVIVTLDDDLQHELALFAVVEASDQALQRRQAVGADRRGSRGALSATIGSIWSCG